MTPIAHALIGASIAARVTDPITASSVAFLTHFICDAIPHWDLGTNWRLRPKVVTGVLAIAETVVALVGTYLIFQNFVPNQTTLILSIIFSLLPDWLEAPYYLLMPNSPKIFYYCYKIQSLVHSRAQAPLGIWTQIITVAIALWMGFNVKGN